MVCDLDLLPPEVTQKTSPYTYFNLPGVIEIQDWSSVLLCVTVNIHAHFRYMESNNYFAMSGNWTKSDSVVTTIDYIHQATLYFLCTICHSLKQESSFTYTYLARFQHEHALEDAREIAQVEGVVRLGGRGQQLCGDDVVDVDTRFHQLVTVRHQRVGWK